MKVLLLLCILAAFVGNASGQSSDERKCELQALAIEAALGDPDAQYDLAVEFHRGDAIPQDLAKAAELWRMAAKGGVISAFNNLGHLTYYGRGIKQNFAQGIRLWRIAATNGHSESQVHLAFAYSDGKYLKPNYIEAYSWGLTGKHFASLDGDPEMRNAVGEMAAEVLTKIKGKLTPRQIALAERRARTYISRYSAK
jgi:TPR repeat protein